MSHGKSGLCIGGALGGSRGNLGRWSCRLGIGLGKLGCLLRCRIFQGRGIGCFGIRPRSGGFLCPGGILCRNRFWCRFVSSLGIGDCRKCRIGLLRRTPRGALRFLSGFLRGPGPGWRPRGSGAWGWPRIWPCLGGEIARFCGRGEVSLRSGSLACVFCSSGQ